MTELEKKQSLSNHKTIATGLFVLMAVLYGVMVYLSTQSNDKWIGYVKAFSEAAMVGALADWFAVTALFRYPLGLKIPHTNLIERSKNAIGDNLGAFVTENFLTSSNIRPWTGLDGIDEREVRIVAIRQGSPIPDCSSVAGLR